MSEQSDATMQVLREILRMPLKSMLEDCCYQGIPPKKWVRETAPYYEGYNKALGEVKDKIKKIVIEEI